MCATVPGLKIWAYEALLDGLETDEVLVGVDVRGVDETVDGILIVELSMLVNEAGDEVVVAVVVTYSNEVVPTVGSSLSYPEKDGKVAVVVVSAMNNVVNTS
jgi:hypothetical protein